MKRRMKVILVLLLVLTVVYIGAVVYASTLSPIADCVWVCSDPNEYVNSHRCVVCAASRCESDSPPQTWYKPEELGIVAIWRIDDRAVQIDVDPQKEPFPLQSKTPVFLYNGDFYMVGEHWVTFWGFKPPPPWQLPIGVTLGISWVLIGALFIKRSNILKI